MYVSHYMILICEFTAKTRDDTLQGQIQKYLIGGVVILRLMLTCTCSVTSHTLQKQSC